MITLHDTYQFFITTPQHGTWQAYPENDKLQWVWKKEDDSAFYRLELNTTLKFKNNAAKGVTDFAKLYELERSEDRCDFVPIEINRKCGDGWFSFWKGYLAVIDGEFDVSKCVLEIKPRIDDEYRCMLNTWDKDYDVYDGPNIGLRPTVTNLTASGGLTIVSNIHFETFYCPPPFACAPTFEFWQNGPLQAPVNSWGIYRQDVVQGIGINGEPFWTRVTYYAREIGVFTLDPGSPWIYIGNSYPIGSYARPIDAAILDENGNVITFKNGLRLNDVIKWLAGSYDEQEQFGLGFCGYEVVSDFFGINPDNTAPSNIAYNYAAQFCHEISIHQITDIKRPNASKPEFIWPFTFKKLLEDLQTMFNVRWVIDSGNILRIEHLSYFDNRNMLDLTHDDFKPFIAGKHKFKYLSEAMPLTETFTFPVQGSQIDFIGRPILYNETCSYNTDAKNESYSTQILFSDVEDIFLNPDKYPNDGYVLISTDSFSTIKSDIGELSANEILNGCFSWANLMYNFHRYGRPQRIGNMNNQDEVFLSWEPKREQVELSFPMCCDDLLNTFDPKDKVRTQLGWGIISECQMEDPGLWFQIKTRHL